MEGFVFSGSVNLQRPKCPSSWFGNFKQDVGVIEPETNWPYPLLPPLLYLLLLLPMFISGMLMVFVSDVDYA